MTMIAAPPQVEPILTDAEVRQFHELGYVIVKGVLSPEEAAYYRDRILDMVPRDLSITCRP
jgi:hypothetical protein